MEIERWQCGSEQPLESQFEEEEVSRKGEDWKVREGKYLLAPRYLSHDW